jgi:hypothetical protein
MAILNAGNMGKVGRWTDDDPGGHAVSPRPNHKPDYLFTDAN